MSLLSCELDARTGGTYRLVFASETIREIAFYGMYLEVPAHSRIVWTKDEGGEGGTITTVAFEEKAGQTLLVIRDLYPTKEALETGLASGSLDGMPETMAQLDELIVSLSASPT